MPIFEQATWVWPFVATSLCNWQVNRLIYLLLLISFQTFDEVENDQFDFHNYSLRRFTMNTYLKCAIPRIV